MPGALFTVSDYSTLRGASRVGALVAKAKELGHTFIGLTDVGTLAGIVPLAEEALKNGLKPIAGIHLLIEGLTDRPVRLPALAIGPHGWDNLKQLNLLSSRLPAGKGLALENLSQWADGLGFGTSDVAQRLLIAQGPVAAGQFLSKLSKAVGPGRTFVQIINNGPESTLRRESAQDLGDVADALGLTVLAGGVVAYASQGDAQKFDAMRCVDQGERLHAPFRTRHPLADGTARLRSAAEMLELYSFRPESLMTTEWLAEGAAFELKTGVNLAPKLTFTDGRTSSDVLASTAREGLKARMGDGVTPEYHDRLNRELQAIDKAGYADYYLVVADLVAWAGQNNIPVGPGRGSSGGSLVAYACGITRIDSIKHGLFFERFINPERVSPPDFDIDFCDRRRGEVLQYLRTRYGAEHTAQISTFGTFGAKGGLRDAAKLYGIAPEEIDRVSGLVPDEVGAIGLKEAYKLSPELSREVSASPKWRAAYALAGNLQDTIRQRGTHAAAMVIAPDEVSKFAPVIEQDGVRLIDADMAGVEKLGLIKLDVLGVSAVSMLHSAADNIRKEQPDFNLHALPLDNQNAFALLREGRTAGLFQMGSTGMTAACQEIGVDNFQDLMAVISLYRPGPMDQIKTYAAAKKDPTKRKPPHPLLASVTESTYGVMIYQEQVMEAAQRVAGFTPGEADILRKAMGKKDAAMMEDMRKKFIAGAETNHQLRPEQSATIFNLLEKFSGYGFNKSHAAGYATLAYQCAYLKANHPEQFMAAALTSKVGKPDDLQKLLADCRRMGVHMLPPDVNRSQAGFTAETQPDGRRGIRFGLSCVKGLGDAATKAILESRAKVGVFTGVQQMSASLDPQIGSARVIGTLIRAGGFDALNPDRAKLYGKFAEKFGVELDKRQSTEWERELLGQYISGHPLDRYRGLAPAITTHTSRDFSSADSRSPVRVAGMVSSLTVRPGQNGRKWAAVTLETVDGPMEATFFAETYAKSEAFLKEGAPIWIRGRVRQDPRFGTKLNAEASLPIEKAISNLVTGVTLTAKPGHGEALLDRVQTAAKASAGAVPVTVTQGETSLGKEPLKITPELWLQFSADPAVLQMTADCSPARPDRRPDKPKDGPAPAGAAIPANEVEPAMPI